MSFIFRKIDTDLLENTRQTWTAILEEQEEHFSPSGYHHFLDSANARLCNADKYPYSHCFAVIPERDASAVALFELTQAYRGREDSWLKVLAMRTSPLYDYRTPETVGNSFMDRSRSVAKVLTKGLTEIVALSETDDYRAHTVKIFGNKQVDMDFFTIFADKMRDIHKNLGAGSFRFEKIGNWLEIRKNGGATISF